MPTEPKDRRIPIMMTASEVDAIDEWRRQQPDLPTRAEAVRRMISRVIAEDAARSAAD